MKNIFSVIVIIGTALFLMSAVLFTDVPQDPPKKNVKKHIKVVKVKDGEKVELDTVIENDDVFVWKGDTVRGGRALMWVSEDGLKLDSLHQHFDMDFDYEIEKDGEGKVIILKSGKDGKKIMREFKVEGDSLKKAFKFDVLKDGEHGHDVMVWHGDDGDNKMIFATPDVRAVPHVPKVPPVPGMIFRGKKGNVIDLSDPGIISYKKKKLSGGREKITIIRNEVEDENEEIHEETILKGAGEEPVIWHNKIPGKSKRVKIIKEDDGRVEIIEDEGIWSVKEGEERVKVIEEDGKVIHIKEINKDGEKKVEVKVEVEEETEKESEKTEIEEEK